MTDAQYFLVGYAVAADTHAAQSYLESGLCSEPLLRVDDRHRYTAPQLAEHVTCRECVLLAQMAQTAGLPAEALPDVG